MANTVSAVHLGGPNHGRRLALPPGVDRWNVVRYSDLATWLLADSPVSNVPASQSVSCRIVQVYVGDTSAKAILWPDIKPSTGERLLEEYVLAAWDAYDITHSPNKRR